MNLAMLLKLAHVFTVLAFVGGLLGRQFTLSQAARSTDVRNVRSLVTLAGRFERLLVIPGSQALGLFGLFTALRQGQPLLGFLQGASSNWLLISIVLVLSIAPVIIWVFLPAGRRFEQALLAAEAQDRVTPELTAAFHDRGVAAGHAYEIAVTVIVTVLMVAKPL